MYTTNDFRIKINLHLKIMFALIIICAEEKLGKNIFYMTILRHNERGKNYRFRTSKDSNSFVTYL